VAVEGSQPASGGGTHMAPAGRQPHAVSTSAAGQTLPPSTTQRVLAELWAVGSHWHGTVLGFVGSQAQMAPGGKQPQGEGKVFGGSHTGQSRGHALVSGMHWPSPPQPHR
jgi:hypothetical protein